MKESRIWKYPFAIVDAFKIEMPKDARILDVDLQGSTPCLWALVNPNGSTEWRYFRVIATGEPLEGQINYIGTFQQPPYVWHLAEMGKS